MSGWDASRQPWEPQEEPAGHEPAPARDGGYYGEQGNAGNGYQAPWADGAGLSGNGQGGGYPQAGYQQQDAGYAHNGAYSPAYGQDPGYSQDPGYGPGYGQQPPTAGFPQQDQDYPQGYGPPGPEGFQLGRRPAGYRPGGFAPAEYGQDDFGGQQGTQQQGYGPDGYGPPGGYQAGGYQQGEGYGYPGAPGGQYGQPEQYSQQPGQYGQPDQYGQPGQPGQYGQPGQAEQFGQPGTMAGDRAGKPPRAGARSQIRSPRRGVALVWVVVGLVVAVGIVYAAVKLTKSNSGSPSSSTTPPSGNGAGHKPSADGSLYKLVATGSAGGFRAAHHVPSFEKNDARVVANGLKTQVGQAGVGTFKSKPITAAYSVGSRHAPTIAIFSGYNGTFNSAAIVGGFLRVISGGHKVAGSPHGGSMACGKGSGGTICMWTTPKTLGVVEFFNSAGPVVLKNAAADAAKIRSGVEVTLSP